MDKKRIIVFVLTSYGFTWVIWVRQAINQHFDLGWSVSDRNHLYAGLGPFFGALSTILVFDKWEGLKKYFKVKLFSLPSAKWIVAGIGMPVFFFALPAAFYGLVHKEWVGFGQIGINSKLPTTNTFLIWLMWCIFYGLGEEGGWRGFLFPEFCKKYEARAAALFTAIIWAIWHLPVFFYDKDFVSMGFFGVVGWMVSMIAGSMLLGWLVKQSRWSLWAVIVWHGTFNLLATSDSLNPVYPGIMSGFVILTTLWILKNYDKEFMKLAK